ncbi:hypothetical protein S7711_10619 [Stachybotrys chartarum IBT 7711]|uniref:Uncharacterized protein n=1 Tax=Stachybotrys chartarum (strain CBS 109288 / IBT 7711) TaxID=1280523 RepID=A0A084AZ43_STACB|nr:hypothetical protein S7711_10619 [Stachybotrys chartarum IBT 7711]
MTRILRASGVAAKKPLWYQFVRNTTAQAWISSYGMHTSIFRLEAIVEEKLKPWIGPRMGWQEFQQYDLGTAVLIAVNLDFAMVASQQIITMSMHHPGTQELTGFDFQPNSNLMKLRGRHRGHLVHLERDPDGYMVDFVAAPHITVYGEKDVKIMDAVDGAVRCRLDLANCRAEIPMEVGVDIFSATSPTPRPVITAEALI